MIYLDTSVVLSQLLAEDRPPPEELWLEPLVTSRLLEYELWTCLHAKHLASTHGDAARLLLAGVSFVELTQPVLSRALQPFPVSVRTLDALHLASVMFLRQRGHDVALATFDKRMCEAASAMSVELFDM